MFSGELALENNHYYYYTINFPKPLKVNAFVTNNLPSIIFKISEITATKTKDTIPITVIIWGFYQFRGVD